MIGRLPVEVRRVELAAAHADGQDAGVAGGLDVDVGVAGGAHLADVEGPGRLHGPVDHVRRGPPAADLVGTYDGVEGRLGVAVGDGPAEGVEQRVGVDLPDLAGQGRIDVFFLGGAQIDGQANINLEIAERNIAQQVTMNIRTVESAARKVDLAADAQTNAAERDLIGDLPCAVVILALDRGVRVASLYIQDAIEKSSTTLQFQVLGDLGMSYPLQKNPTDLR